MTLWPPARANTTLFHSNISEKPAPIVGPVTFCQERLRYDADRGDALMADGWILDVLADMRAFARDNDLPRLAEQLDNTALIAAAELADRDRIKDANPHSA